MNKTEKEGLVVLFPGIGYTCDRPLLYYPGRMLQSMGYQIVPVSYGGFPANVKGDAQKMRECFFTALDQAEAVLEKIDFSAFDDVIFIGKSVGTVVALHYAKEHDIDARFVLLTPVEEAFEHLPQLVGSRAAAFYGTSDPWARTEIVTSACTARKIPLYVFADANHSLETGDVETDIKYLQQVVRHIREFAGVKK